MRYNGHDTSQTLLFDDEPVTSVLYEQGARDATPADVFLPIKEHMAAVRSANATGDTKSLAAALVKITEAKMALHKPICDEIIDITVKLIPNVPLPTLSHDVICLTPLLEKIWDLQQLSRANAHTHDVGARLYRCYEHQGRYNDARRILRTLVRITKADSDLSNQALYLNNLAFEYLLEERWQDAMPLFQAAETLFFEVGDRFNCANSRSNYLDCVFALRPAEELGEHKSELLDLANEMLQSGTWHVRKPFVLLSKILESENDLSSATDYMRKAIGATENKEIRWTEIDGARLENLEAKSVIN